MKTVLLAILFCPIILFGQKTHTVGPKETLFSIGRQYKIHPRELAEFNQIPYGSGLTIGQVLKIPSKTSLAPLAATSAPAEPVAEKSTVPAASQKVVYENVPVYHTVTKKETLFQISKKNKASIPDLKKWNQLRTDALKDGMQLIVGYKKQVKKSASPTPAPEKVPVTGNVKEEPVATVAVVQKEEPPVKAPAVPEKTEPVAPVPSTAVPVPALNTNMENVFKPDYDAQVAGRTALKEKSGLSGVFKSGSGWQDGKFYCLFNQAAPGTILRISLKGSNQVVYAKTLDVIPDMKQNEGLVIVLSNAAAAKLGVADSRFECSITY